MSESSPNPFVVQKYFAQWMITSNYTSGGRLHVAYNMTYILIYLTMFIYCILSDNSIIGGRYNLISSMRFYVQTFICTMLFVQVSITTTLFRANYLNCLQVLRDIDTKLKLIDIETRYNLKPTIAIYVVLFMSTSAVLAVDIYYFGDKYVWPYFVCQYIPSLAISVYVLTISMLMEISGDKFDAINVYLQQFTMSDENLITKYYFNKGNAHPKKLLEMFPYHRITTFHMIFNIVDEYIDNVRMLNSLCGFDLLLFMIIVTVDILSFVYDICMDLGQYINGYNMPPRSIYAIEYWSVIWMFGLVILLNATSELMRKSNQTKYYLHQLRNLYPSLDKHAEMFSLQLLHSTLNITAARFLTINWGIIYTLVSTWITYILIFVQLEDELDENSNVIVNSAENI